MTELDRELSAFTDFLNEPPEFEDMRRVRDYRHDAYHQWTALLPQIRVALSKRPVAFRVKDFADGWILFQDEEVAIREAKRTGALMQGLYVRDGTLFPEDEK